MGTPLGQSAGEAYWWMNGIGAGLTLTIAYMSAHAYGLTGTPDKALVCIICQLLAIVFAILARRALMAEMPVAALTAAAAAIGCAVWASKGLTLAWTRDGSGADAWMVIFLTALEPGLFLLAEHIKDARLKQLSDAARNRAISDEEERLRLEAQRVRTVGALGMAGLLAGTAGAETAAPAGPAPAGPQGSTHQISTTNFGFATWKAHAQHLALEQLRAGNELNFAEISRQVGVSRASVSRLLAKFKADHASPQRIAA